MAESSRLSPLPLRHSSRLHAGGSAALWGDCDGRDAVRALRAFEPQPPIVIASGTAGNLPAVRARPPPPPRRNSAARRLLGHRDRLTLLVAGFSYREIAELTGGRTYTNVNKHIAKARARVRLARLSDAADAGRDGPYPDVVKR